VATEVGNNQSVERAFAVLSAFTGGQPELRVSDVAKRAGLGLSTASRLLATLESVGAVERDPVSGLYRLGLDLVTYAGIALNQHRVHRAARQLAQELAARLGLGANVAVRRGDTLCYLLNFEGARARRNSVLIGAHNPLHATGLGKCLLSGLSPAQRRELLPADSLVGYTPHTLTDHQRLDAELEQLAAHGYTKEVEELAFSRACVAAPIRDQAGAVVAALSVSGPLSVIDLAQREDELSRAVVETADSISIALGYAGPHAAGASA
jgi:DNA-binding IclR family transcriptional regulator